MRYRKRVRIWLLAILCQSVLPAVVATTSAGEEYSRSGGGPLRVRLSPAARHSPPSVPKSLEELRRLTGESFLCVKRENFLVASDLGPGEYEYMVDGVLDFCRSALVKTYFDKIKGDETTVNIFIFRDYASYQSGLRQFLGMDPISPYGHYGHSQKYIVINYETGPGTMVHELTHALMSEDFPEAPIWLAEGMASLYEQCRAEGGTIRGDDNWRLPELKAAITAGELAPLPAFLAMSPQTFRGKKESLYYAQSRYFCKYMEELGLLPAVYKEFRAGHHLDPTGSQLVIKAFGKPLDLIDASWRRWIAFQYWKE